MKGNIFPNLYLVNEYIDSPKPQLNNEQFDRKIFTK